MNDSDKARERRPNLFKYATKELSQDAFLCWLAEWADIRFASIDSNLHQCGQEFIKALLSGSKAEGLAINTVEPRKQVLGNIDVALVINDTESDSRHLLIIEDKTDTGLHNDQEIRYPKALADHSYYGGFKDKTTFVYLKTGDQSDYTAERRANWRVFRRQEMLQLLRRGRPSGHPILIDFLDHMEKKQAAFESWENKPFFEWKTNGSNEPWTDFEMWKGFYAALQEKLENGGYGYVSNARGGFVGFWFGGVPVSLNNNYEVYLSYGQTNELLVRISSKNGTPIENDIVLQIREKIFQSYASQLNCAGMTVEKSDGRKGKKTMQLAIIKDTIKINPTNLKVNLEATVANLQKCRDALCKVFK